MGLIVWRAGFRFPVWFPLAWGHSLFQCSLAGYTRGYLLWNIMHSDYRKTSVFILYFTYITIDFPGINIHSIIIFPKSSMFWFFHSALVIFCPRGLFVGSWWSVTPSHNWPPKQLVLLSKLAEKLASLGWLLSHSSWLIFNVILE